MSGVVDRLCSNDETMTTTQRDDDDHFLFVDDQQVVLEKLRFYDDYQPVQRSFTVFCTVCNSVKSFIG